MKKKINSLVIFCFIGFAAIFIFDHFVPNHYLVSLAYLIFVALATWMPGVRYLFIFAGLATVLSLLDLDFARIYHLSSPQILSDVTVINRVFFLACLWGCTIILLWRKIERDKKEKLISLSLIDDLTQVYSRRYFTKRLSIEWRRLARERKPLSIIMLDIDYFKRYNDTLGHPAGDECLRKIAGIIDEQIHRADDFIARYGGEEFIIFMPNTDEEGALLVAKKIQRSLEVEPQHHPTSDIADHVTVSMGIATRVPTLMETPDSLVGKADQALYKSKNNGRNCFHFYTKC